MTHALAVAAGVAVALVGLLICASVISRTLGHGGIGAAEEYAGALTMAAVFAGIAHTYREGGHVRATVVADRLPVAGRRGLEIFAATVSFAFAAILLTALAENWWHLYQSGARSPSRQFEQWIPMSVVVVGSFLLVLETLCSVARAVSRRGPGPDDRGAPETRAIAAGLDTSAETASGHVRKQDGSASTTVATSRKASR